MSFSGVRIAQTISFCFICVDKCPFFGRCFICRSSNYWGFFLLPLCYLQTFQMVGVYEILFNLEVFGFGILTPGQLILEGKKEKQGYTCNFGSFVSSICVLTEETLFFMTDVSTHSRLRKRVINVPYFYTKFFFRRLHCSDD
jgi:hypothetical protein